MNDFTKEELEFLEAILIAHAWDGVPDKYYVMFQNVMRKIEDKKTGAGKQLSG